MRRLAVLALVAIAGCVTPSIPIPPPDPSMMSFELSLDPQAGSVVSLTMPPNVNYVDGIAYVYNQSLGVGVIQLVKADGSIGPTPPLTAVENHRIVVSVESGDQTVSTCVLLRQGAPSGYCP